MKKTDNIHTSEALGAEKKTISIFTKKSFKIKVNPNLPDQFQATYIYARRKRDQVPKKKKKKRERVRSKRRIDEEKKP